MIGNFLAPHIRDCNWCLADIVIPALITWTDDFARFSVSLISLGTCACESREQRSAHRQI